MSTRILTTSGRGALAKAVLDQSIHLGLGSGLDTWDASNPTPPPLTATELTTPLGYRVARVKRFVQEEADGELTIEGRRYGFAGTDEITNLLYLRFDQEPNDLTTGFIREQGIFLGGAQAAGLAAGQEWFTPAQMTSLGTLYLLIRTAAQPNDAATRVSHEFVLAF